MEKAGARQNRHSRLGKRISQTRLTGQSPSFLEPEFRLGRAGPQKGFGPVRRLTSGPV